MVKKGQYQYYHISLYKCNEKHDGTYIEASLYNCRPPEYSSCKKIRRTELDVLTKANDL